MAFMPWTEDFVTGLPQIDEQHRWLVDATNRLYDEITKPQVDNAAVNEILNGLIDYTFNHFILEEDLFNRHGYPESRAHIAEHNKFTKETAALLEKFEQGDSVKEEALEFLKEWLSHHILQVDMAYVPFMKEKGL
jgi:hemerythrin